MPLAETFVFGFDAAAATSGRIGYLATASGNALLVALAGAPIVVNINLDLADDEVCIGTELAGGPAGTRALNQGRADGLNHVPETIPRLVGAQASAIGKAEDSAHASADVGVMSLAVRSDAGGSLVDADGDYAPPQVRSDGLLRVDAPSHGTTSAFSVTAVAAASVVIAAANPARRAITIQNGGPGPLYIRPGGGAALATDFLIEDEKDKTFEHAAGVEWRAISNAVGTSAVVIEERD